MDNNIKVNINVTSNGTTDKETKKAKELHAALDNAAKAGARVAGTAGSRAVAAKALPPQDRPTSQTIGQGFMAAEVQQYGTQRGAAGMTGASARDFANQAQGLGGLVRLYATYAANVFAVGAAFRALSTAMDTTNMVRGLDQIGAASGVALGGLSKQLVAATGGAISLREAMSATVKVTAAGLGSENVLRLGQVAAKASQALGVDMTDAIGRLSRGITKLEPELLDELGIFTKIDPAVEKYAITLGKTAGQLTDFERRQAFANAVLEEGEQKFAAIKVDANPYNKLAASLANLAQSGLELVNNVLGPLVNLLSTSPAALIAAVAGVAATIIKQAVPAFGLFRENIQRANQEASQAAQSRAAEAVRIQKDVNAKVLALVEARANTESEILDQAEERFKALRAQGAASPAVQRVLRTESTVDITEKQLATIDRAALAAQKKGLTEQAEIYRELATAIRNGQEAEKEYQKVKAQGSADLTKDIQSRKTIIGLNFALAESAEKADFKNQIKSNAAYTASLIGPTAAIRLMRAEIDASGFSLGKFEKILLVTRGSISAFAGAAAVLGSALSGVLGIVMAVIGVGSLLVGLFTNTAKESRATSEAMDQLEESTKGLSNTVDLLNKKPFLEQFTAESVNARANALEGFSVALAKANQAAQKELATMNWLDKATDITKMLWSGDVQSKLNKETAYGIATAFKEAQLSSSEAGKAAQTTIAKLLKIDVADLKDFDKVVDALSKISGKELLITLPAINKQFEELAKTNRTSATRLLGVDDAFKKVTEARQKFTQGILSTDPFSEFGRGLISAGFEIEQALANPTTKLQAIRRLFEEIKDVGGIGSELLVGLSDLNDKAKQLQNVQAAIASLTVPTENLTARQKELQEVISNKNKNDIGTRRLAAAELEKINAELESIRAGSDLRVNLKLNLETEIKQAQEVLNTAQAKVFETGANIVSSKLSTEFAKAGQTITSAFASLLTGTEIGAKLRAEAEKAALAAQLQQIKATEQQIRATAENTVALKESQLLAREAQLRNDPTVSDQTAAAMKQVNDGLRKEINALKLALSPEGTFSKLSQQKTQDLKAQRESAVTPEALKLAESLDASRAAISNISAQSYVTELKLQDELLKIGQNRSIEQKNRDLQALKAARDLAVANQAVFNQTNETALLERQRLDTQIRLQEESIRQADAGNRIQALEFARNKVLESQLPKRKEISKQIQNQIDLVKRAAQESTATARLNEEAQQQKNILDLIQLRGKVAQEQLDREGQASQNRLSLRTQELDAEQKSFDILSRTINLSPEYIAQEQEILEKKKAQLEFEKQLQQLTQTKAKATQELDTQESLIKATATADETGYQFTVLEAAALAEIAKKRQDINTTYQAGLGLQASITAGAYQEAAARRQIADEQNRNNKLLESTANVGASLKGIFEELGSSADRFAGAIEGVLTTFSQIGITAQKNAQTVSVFEKKLQEAYDDTDSSSEKRAENIAKAEKDLGDAKTKQVKDELSGNIKLVSSAKMLFKEKSTGYKIMAGIEKAMHIAKLAMSIKEMVVDTTATGASLANSATRTAGSTAEAAVDGVKAVVKAISSLPFPLNLAAGAATAAVVGTLLSQIGAKGPNASGGSTALGAEKQQEVQGTAQTYDESGKLVQFRRGVLGDPSAKSKLIDETLQILSDNSVDNLEVNNKMLAALYKIEAGIRGVTAGIYNIPGLAFGSIFGTQEGGSSTKILGGLFGKSTSREIIDSGLKVSGSLADLAKNAAGLVDVFETVRTTRSRSVLGFGSSKSRVSTQETGLDELGTPQARRLANALNKTFEGALDFLEETAQAAGLGAGVATALVESLDLPEQIRTFSARGLKPEEMGAAFQAWLGGVIDFYGEQIFKGAFDEFARAGEEITQTVARVVQENKVVVQSFKNLGFGDIQQDIARLTGATGIDLQVAVGRATQSLVDLSGGIEKFAEKQQFIAEKFLTEAQRRTATEERLQAELTSIGLSGLNIASRQQYVDALELVKQAVAAGKVGASELYTQLQNLAPLYDTLLPAFENSAEAIKEYTDGITKQTQEIQRNIDLLNATDYARAISGITESYVDSIEQLKKEGNFNRETLAAANSLAEAQIALLNAQNAAKATEIIAGLNAEVAAMNLGTLGKELLGITNKAKNYAEQLVNLNQATDENISALRAWEAAMMEAARAARREAQATQYAQLFSANQSEALAQKFAKLGFSLPGNIQQLQFIVDGIDATTDAGLELRGKLLDLGSEFKSLIDTSTSALRSAYDARVQEVKGLQDQFKNFAKSIRDFRQSLLTGAMSPLTPVDRYGQAKSEFERIAALAASGDIQAMEKLEGASSSFLEASREVYASSELYTQDFNRVLEVLDTTTSVADLQVQIAENTLMEIKNIVGGIIDLSGITEAGVVSITGLGPQLQKALQDVNSITAQVSQENLAGQIAIANANNAAIGNVASGVDAGLSKQDSNTQALDAMRDMQRAYYDEMLKQEYLNQQANNFNNQQIINAINGLKDPVPVAPPPPPPPSGAAAAAASSEPYYGPGGYYYGTNIYMDPGAAGGGFAKGGAFMGGVEMFARGGIVESPTLFKFARGTGLMGEAGPEAIMPLRRDTRGNLGVIAQQNNEQLLEQIAKLNQQVEQLTQVVAQGAVINAQATDRNTEAITTTIQGTAAEKQYMKKVQSRTSIV